MDVHCGTKIDLRTYYTHMFIIIDTYVHKIYAYFKIDSNGARKLRTWTIACLCVDWALCYCKHALRLCSTNCGVTDYVPVMFPSAQLFICTGEGCAHNETIPIHYRHVTLAMLTGFLFATHLPERLAPGTFDYIGETIKTSMPFPSCCY